MKIETIGNAQFEAVLPLIAAYQEFYRQVPSLERNRTHFSQYLTNHEQGILFGAFLDDKAIGFCTLYFLPSSLSGETMCVLNDIYTLPEYRGLGVARALLAESRTYAKQRGFSNLEWWTAESNATAQRLYDQLGARRSAWYLYDLPT